MRIPVGRIYRAFPELDRFNDEQCEMFVRAACRRGWRRHAHRLLILLATIVSLILVGFAVALVTEWLDHVVQGGVERSGWFAPYVILCILAMCSPFLLALLLKDRLLLRRLRLVIRARGTCPSCRYTLLGVTIDEGNTVLCPECGMTLEADPELNEVVLDDQGRRSFMPSGQHKSLDFWTPKRRRIAKRLAVVAGVFVFVVLPAAWGGYEIFLHRQAAKARADRPDAAGIMEFVEAGQPEGSADEPNAWDTIDILSTELQDARITTFSLPRFQADRVSAEPVFDFIWSGLPEESRGTLRRRNQHSLDTALAMLDALEAQGSLDTLDSLADHRRAVHNITLGPNTPAVMLLLPSLSDVRQLARVNAARMHLAVEADDRETFVAAFESGLALARCCYHQPTLIESLVGDAIVSLMHGRVQAAILQHPDPEWLDGIEAAIERQRPPVGPDHRYRGEELMGLDTICWFFSQTKNTRFGRFSSAIGGLFGGFGVSNSFDTRLGTYAENRDAYTESFQYFINTAGTDAVSRPAPPPPDPSGLLLVEILEPALNRVHQTSDEITARVRATTTMIALERYRHDHDTYPLSLDQLVPDYLTALPKDPWSGDPLQYQLIAPGSAPAIYQLFTNGRDLTPDPPTAERGTATRPDDIIFSPPSE